MKQKISELNEKEKNVLTIIVVLAVFIIFIAYTIIDKKLEENKILKESMKTVLVTDPSRYFTVINCAKKYLTIVQEGNREDILILLNDGYKERNRVVASNLNNHIPALEKDSIYEYAGSEMYQHRISKNVVEYYVKGKIKKSILDENPTYRDYDLTVVLYENELTFSIIPGIGGLNEQE